MKSSKTQVALAILYGENKILMQLRDDIPEIACPDRWGLFGGHLELEETPQVALIRELKEEINFTVEKPLLFNSYEDTNIIRHIFYAPLTVTLDKLELNEGRDLGLISLEEINRGLAYSSKIQQSKLLGDKHQQILLEFIAKKQSIFK